MTFVKKGRRLIMWVHYTSVDWFLAVDLDKKYIIFHFIVFTQNYNLRSPFTIYNSAKKWILIDFTCPC